MQYNFLDCLCTCIHLYILKFSEFDKPVYFSTNMGICYVHSKELKVHWFYLFCSLWHNFIYIVGNNSIFTK